MNPKSGTLLFLSVAAALTSIFVGTAGATEPSVKAEVVVYGGTPAGIMAAVAAARHGHTVSLIDINNHVGGVVSGGLCTTDIGDRKTVAGLANEFFERIVKFYAEKYGPNSQQLKACRNGVTFEPHVAEAVFEQMLKEQPGITLWRKHRYRSVTLDGGRVAALVTDNLAQNTTRTFAGEIFIDASYEGDVMAGASVPYRIGREARAEFGEYLAGISDGPKELRGLGDHRTQAYNYRVALTLSTPERVLVPKPENYDPEPFRVTDGERIKSARLTTFGGLFTTLAKAGPNGIFDANWWDFVGNSEGYADGDWTTRERIAQRLRDRIYSRLYYLQNDPELPESFRADAQTWGFPKAEFTDNGHFPFQLYVREGRRMLGRYILRENDLTQDRWKQNGIATGSYGIDSHAVQYILHEGRRITEHTRHTALNNYDIPYACMTPIEPDNLLVPVCLSTTHVAYCSLRMEPVFMMLGHAAGNAAHLALAEKTSVQKVDVPKFRELLVKEGAVLDAGYQPPVKITWTPARPQVGEKVTFKAVAGALKDPLTLFAWDFEGNGKVGAKGEQAEVSFALEKVHGVSLVVQDQAGRRRWISAEVPVGNADARDVTMDDFDADEAGRWNGTFPELIPGLPLRSSDIFFGPGVHSDVFRQGAKLVARLRFQPTIPRAGRYQVCLGFRPGKKQATNVPILIRHAGGNARQTVNEREELTPFAMVPIGEFRFAAGDAGFVEITNGGTDGVVVVDSVRWVWLGE